MSIYGKTVLVTGANRGIGQALVTEALARGVQRVYAGTRGSLVHPDRRVTPLRLDVTSDAQIRAAAEQIGSLDILVNNAGVALYDDLTERAALEQSLAVNLFGTWGVTQAFLPLLTRSAGAIVNNVSVMALAACPAGRARRAGTRGPHRPHRHRHDPRLRDSEGLAGVRGAGHLRWRGERRGGHFPRPDDAIYRGGMAHRCRQGHGAPERSVRDRPRRGLSRTHPEEGRRDDGVQGRQPPRMAQTVITTVLTTSFGWTGGQQRPPDGQFPNVPGGRRESRFRRLIKGNAGGR